MIKKISNFLAVLSPIIGFGAYYFQMIDWFALFGFFTFGPILLLIPQWIINKRQLQEKFKPAAFDFLEMSAIVIFAINSFGAIFAFKKISDYDTAAHILNSAIIYFVFLILLFRRNGKYSDKAITVIFLFLAITSLGILWEVYQKYSDVLLGTHMFFDPGQPINVDVAIDTFSNMIGAFIAAIAANFYWKNIKEKFLK